MASFCNRCRTGSAEFYGHIFKNNTSKIYSRFVCENCGTVFDVERNPVGPNGFDIEHPDAFKRMLPTDDWLNRQLKSQGLL